MRFPTRSIAGAAAALMLVGLVGCDSMSNLFSPGRSGSNAPASLAFAATLPRFQESAFSSLQLQVVAMYQRADESFAGIGSQVLPLSTSAQTQQLPLSIELGTCLSDETRRDATTDPRACFVRLSITLVGDDRALDFVQLPVVRLTAGSTTTIGQPILLYEVASVTITSAASTTPLPTVGVSLMSGESFAAAARPVDATGVAITGRTSSWSSSNTSIATVSAAGVVTAVAPGSATISATVGGRTGSALFTVTPPARLLTVVGVSSTGTGRVTSSPAGIDCVVTAGTGSGSCSASFPSGTVVQLTSTVNPETARFSGWTGACLTSGVLPTCILTMDEPRTTGVGYDGLSAISVQSGGSGVRIVSGPAAGISCTLDGASGTGACSALFPIGSTVVLTPENISTARVSDFTGCTTATPTSCTILVASTPRTVSVAVTPGRLLLVSAVGSGSGIISAPGVDPVVADPNISCGLPAIIGTGVCSSRYPIGSEVLVRATPQPGSLFTGWTGGGCDGSSSATCLVSMIEASVALRATFQPIEAEVTFLLSGSGGGRVFADGALVCELTAAQTSTSCIVDLPLNQTITFTGAALTVGQFLGFGGACPALTSCELSLTGPVTISASFVAEPPSVLITASPRASNMGLGFISDNMEEMNCDIVGATSTGTCSIVRAFGALVTVYAFDFIDNDPSYVFTRWGPDSPCPDSVEPECTFIANVPSMTVDAEFVPARAIEVALSGSENGQLSVSVSGFRSLPSCVYVAPADPLQCYYYVPLNSSVAMEAITNMSSAVGTGDAQFCAWSGPLWNQSCSFTITTPVAGAITFFVTELAAAATDVGAHESRLHMMPWRPRDDKWRRVLTY